MLAEQARAQALLQRSLTELRRRSERIQALERDLSALRLEREAATGNIAIVGKSIRLPARIRSVDAFWELLETGGRTIGRLEDVDHFDPHFFGLSQTEAESIDPQQRLLLELAWDAMTDAAMAPARLAGKAVGVYTATAAGDYAALVHAPSQLDQINAFTTLGAAASVGAGRIAYTFDFCGPVLNVDASCASSLAALHLAAAALRRGECELAIVAATNLVLGPGSTHGLTQMGALSPSGHCAAFADTADGYVRGEGGAAIVLKRLADARRDGDPIAAVLAGSAMNHDGRSNGLSAPNAAAQSAVVRAALRDAQISGDRLWYVEAHGTGTRLGDPIEVSALTAALERAADRPLPIGSVKANVGHLEAAAGIIGVVKLLLMLAHRRIPAQPALGAPNSLIAWNDTPLQPAWSAASANADQELYAGVSGFGMSGTNVHMILRTDPLPREDAVVAPLPVLPLAAHGPASLELLHSAYQHRINSGSTMTDVLLTAQRSQSPLPFRTALVGNAAQISAALTNGIEPVNTCGKHSRIAFVFQGQGSQFPGMAREWYALCPVFRAQIDRFLELADRQVPWLGAQRLRQLLLEPKSAAGEEIHQTRYAQPCLFAYSYALQACLRRHGVDAEWVAGHSLGEWVAATAAGILPVEEAFTRVCARALVMHSAADGAMAALFCDRARAGELLAATKATLAAHNGPQHCVVAGDQTHIDLLLAQAQSAGIGARRLQVAHAFHSPALDPLLGQLADAFTAMRGRAGRERFVSGVDGRLLDGAQLNPAYWVTQTRAPVDFEAVRRTLLEQGANAVIDIGPGMVLSSLWEHGMPVLAVARRDAGAAHSLAWLLADLFRMGVDVDWLGARPPGPVRFAPPPYPFARQRMDDRYLSALTGSAPVPSDGGLVWSAQQVAERLTGTDEPQWSASNATMLATAMLSQARSAHYRTGALHEVRVGRSWHASPLRLQWHDLDPTGATLEIELQAGSGSPLCWTRLLRASAYRLPEVGSPSTGPGFPQAEGERGPCTSFGRF